MESKGNGYPPVTPEGLSAPSGLRDDEAGKGLIFQETIGGSPKSKAESLGMCSPTSDQKPHGPAKDTVRGSGTRSGMSFEI